ncbi:MAG: hypothetical protein KDA21_13795 [Phycisphaerales bacterium]|nr:hypothetical protein [Phycisphaerales bacterium]
MQLREALPSRLTKKTCLSCGYHGRALQGERGLSVYQCPACDADLYARPPRSYAEMEGLLESDVPVPSGARTLVVRLEGGRRRHAWPGLPRRLRRLCRLMLGRCQRSRSVGVR